MTCAVSTPTLTTSVGANSGAPVASVIGARSARLRVSTQVLPLPQLRVHQRRLGDDLPLVAVLPQVQGGRRRSSRGRRRGPRWRSSPPWPSRPSTATFPSSGAQRRVGEVGRGLLQQRGGRVRVGGGARPRRRCRRRPRPRGRSSPRRARRPRRCRSRRPGRARSSSSGRGEGGTPSCARDSVRKDTVPLTPRCARREPPDGASEQHAGVLPDLPETHPPVGGAGGGVEVVDVEADDRARSRCGRTRPRPPSPPSRCPRPRWAGATQTPCTWQAARDTAPISALNSTSPSSIQASDCPARTSSATRAR